MIDQPAVPADPEGTNRIVKEIRKLHWIGQEREAVRNALQLLQRACAIGR